jgi:VanZ family protein
MHVRIPLLPWWLRWGAAVGLATFIFYTSILTVPPETVVDQARPELLPLDKWRHLVAYATLAYSLAYATVDRELDRRIIAGIVIVVTVIYGVGIEFGQSFLPNRYFSLGDAYANALGGLLVLPWYLIQRYIEYVPMPEFIRRMYERDEGQ